MMINTDSMIAMTDANQNFSKVVRIVDENGVAVILKNNKPRYILVDFNAYEQMQTAKLDRATMIDQAADRLIAENMEAFLELAK